MGIFLFGGIANGMSVYMVLIDCLCLSPNAHKYLWLWFQCSISTVSIDLHIWLETAAHLMCFVVMHEQLYVLTRQMLSIVGVSLYKVKAQMTCSYVCMCSGLYRIPCTC